ncbi:MAG: alanine racemase [Holophaga sp.]|jgi:alanine racemase
MEVLLRDAWAEVNLDHLAHNIREVRRVVRPGCRVAAVIKADGYGHGAVAIAGTMLANGADLLAVAVLPEALQLRRAYPEAEIMLLGATPAALAGTVVANRVVPTVFTRDCALALSEAARSTGRKARIHLKLETGMGRIGMPATPETVDRILDIAALPGIEVEGAFTHFAKADEPDKTVTQVQFEGFMAVMDRLEAKGLRIPLRHVSNSGAIIDLRACDLDMVRPGLMLYGLYPSGSVSHEAVRLKEAMALKARVSHVKELPPGCGISYGHIYHTRGTERIATLPVGYADGYSRLLSGKAHVLVRGRRVPVVGRICMDQCMVNVTGLEVEPGEVVTLFGGEEDGKVWIDDVADWMGTITHEVVCGIDKRVPRVYLKGGKVVGIRDYVQELQALPEPAPAF